MTKQLMKLLEWDPCLIVLMVSSIWGHSEELAVCKLERKFSPEANHTGTLI